MNSETLSRAVAAKVEALQALLLAKVEANLSGDVLQSRSGALKASITAAIGTAGDVITAKIASVGVPYAAIQEEGGCTSPHEIVPVKVQALRLANGVFARCVRHPGAQIPPHRYMAGVLEALQAEMVGGLKDVVRIALGAS